MFLTPSSSISRGFNDHLQTSKPRPSCYLLLNQGPYFSNPSYSSAKYFQTFKPLGLARIKRLFLSRVITKCSNSTIINPKDSLSLAPVIAPSAGFKNFTQNNAHESQILCDYIQQHFSLQCNNYNDISFRNETENGTKNTSINNNEDSDNTPTVIVYNIHEFHIPYDVAWRLQKSLVKILSDQREKRRSSKVIIGAASDEKRKGCRVTSHNSVGIIGAALILQHPPTYTLGTGSTLANVKMDPNSSLLPQTVVVKRLEEGMASSEMLLTEPTDRHDGLPSREKYSCMGDKDLKKGEREPLEIFRSDRGGEITCHSPGQLVLYTIFNLQALHEVESPWIQDHSGIERFERDSGSESSKQEKKKMPDLHCHVRSLEEVAIRCLDEVSGVTGERRKKKPGVWIQNRKIAALGVAVKRWITSHGIALNVSKSCLPLFDRILPCGIVGAITTCVEREVEEQMRDNVLRFKDNMNLDAQDHESRNTQPLLMEYAIGIEECIIELLGSRVRVIVVTDKNITLKRNV
mmetsp:Transcript_1819/g.2644  ORF Transcript_1819/g.2644 Transcript_1819/m.2644 type:complete len:519 (-) Transcript_1819:114-1670(-)